MLAEEQQCIELLRRLANVNPLLVDEVMAFEEFLLAKYNGDTSRDRRRAKKGSVIFLDFRYGPK